MGLVIITSFGEVDLIADPLQVTFRTVPGVGIVGEAINLAAGAGSLTSRHRSGPGGSVYCSAQTCRNVWTAET